MSPKAIVIDFCEDLRIQLTQELAEKGVKIPAGLNAEKTIHFFLNLQLRTLRPQPRKVYWSDVLQCRTLSPEFHRVINKIAAISEAGGDLNPYLSDKLIKKPGYYDDLLNDWGIFHLHLADPKTPRSADLLYVYPQPTEIYLLDVQKHGDCFGDTQLVETLHRNWPSLLTGYQLDSPRSRGVPSNPLPSEIIAARRAGIQPIVTLSDGSVHMPCGGGISTSRLNAQIAIKTDELLDRASRFEQICRQGAGKIRDAFKAQMGLRLEQLHLKAMLIDAELIVVETQVNVEIKIPDQWSPRRAGYLFGDYRFAPTSNSD